MNNTFIMLALLVTFCYIIYYAVMISRDIVNSRKTKGGEIETFETGEEDTSDSEEAPRYIGEDGESGNPVEREGKPSEVDNQPHGDINEQVGNDQQSTGGESPDAPQMSEEQPSIPAKDYRMILGYAKEVALETPVKPEYEQLIESDEYLEEMMAGIDNSSQIKIIYQRL